MSDPTPNIRPGTAAYIDEAVTEPLENLQIADDDPESSGSSVEEETESEGGLPTVESLPSGENDVPKQRLEDFAYLDQRRQASGSEDYSDESDWDVDDEDWELANGGALLLSYSLQADFGRLYQTVQSTPPTAQCPDPSSGTIFV